MSLRSLNIDNTWTLFLDRDGVINEKLEDDYVKNWNEFKLLPGVIKALKILTKIFGRTIIVTNQRGIDKGIMTREDLEDIHSKLLKLFNGNDIKIDAIYYCPDVDDSSPCRKPNPGMVLEAKRDFPDIVFEKSMIIGDSSSDIELGKRLGMVTVFIGKEGDCNADMTFKSLYDVAKFIESKR